MPDDARGGGDGDANGAAAVFSVEERKALLALKGVGPSVVARFEQLGIASLAALAAHEPEDICAAVSAALGTTCWRNSPQARAAVTAAVGLAREAR